MNQKPSFDDFLSFNIMVTPVAMKFFYIIGAVIGAIVTLVTAAGSFTGLVAMFILLMGIVWQVVFRISCEVMILLFSIHREVVEIRKGTTPESDNLATPIQVADPPPPEQIHNETN